MSNWFYRTPCLCLFFHYLGAPTAGFRVIDGSRDPVASRRFDDLVNEARLVIEMVIVIQARIAREAYRDFGRGSGHPARLNFGDCFA